MTIDTYFIEFNNNIIYIGSSCNLRKRINRHYHNYKKCQFPLYRFMRSKTNNPKRDFKFFIIETNHTLEEAKHSERYYIKIYNPICNKQCPKI